MRTFCSLTAIVALSILSVFAAPAVVHTNGVAVNVIHTKPNGVIQRDVDATVHHDVPAVDAIPGRVTVRGNDDTSKEIPKADTTTPGNLNGLFPRAGRGGKGGKGSTHRARPKGVVPRAGDDNAVVRALTTISGHVNNVIPRDSNDEPPCDGDDSGNGNGKNPQ